VIHLDSQSFKVSKLLPFPLQPPNMNISHLPESPLKKNLGTAALHGPIAEAKLQTSSTWSSTRCHEVDYIAARFQKIQKNLESFNFEKLSLKWATIQSHLFAVPVRNQSNFRSIHVILVSLLADQLFHQFLIWFIRP